MKLLYIFRTTHKACLKLTTKTAERVNDVVIVSLFLTLIRFHRLFLPYVSQIVDFALANTGWDIIDIVDIALGRYDV